MNRSDLQQLADDRVLDAQALLNTGRWSGAYYVCGYAVECALKACIAKKTDLHDFPDKAVVEKSYTHDLTRLLDLAGLKLQLQLDTTPAANPALGINWQHVKDWSERSRYQQALSSRYRCCERSANMDQEPLVVEETDAGAELVRRLDKYIPVKAAFWVKLSEEGQWYLYIASDQINDRNLDMAYGEVLRLADQMANSYLDPFRVKLIPTSDPLAQAALDVHRRYPGRMATRFGGKDFGGLGVDGVYIYPDSVTSLAP